MSAEATRQLLTIQSQTTYPVKPVQRAGARVLLPTAGCAPDEAITAPPHFDSSPVEEHAESAGGAGAGAVAL